MSRSIEPAGKSSIITAKPRRTIAVIVACIVALVVICSSTLGGSSAGWGHGQIKASERWYCNHVLRRIIQTWRREASEIDNPRTGLIEAPYNSYFVIDIEGGVIYLEQDGQVRPGNTLHLPKNMKWLFYRATPSGHTDMPPLLRLKMRGVHTGKDDVYPEVFCLTGHSRGPGHITFRIESGNGGCGYGGGAYKLADYSGRKKPSETTYGTMLVTEAEYAASPHPNQPAAETVDNYFDVEPQLYEQIEAQIIRAGLELGRINVVPGLDLTTARAHASVEPEEPSFLSRQIERYFGISGPKFPSRAELLLKINRVDKDLWYVKTAPYFKRDPQEELIDFDFLVTSEGRPRFGVYGKQLAEARKQFGKMKIPTSDHKAVLQNGVTIEMIGVCDYPSIGRQWWGPDGQPIASEPTCFCSKLDYDDLFGLGAPRSTFELAWRVNFPPGSTSTNVRYYFGSASGSSGMGGAQPPTWIMIRRASPYKDTDRLNITIEASANSSPFESVTFNNISLRPNHNPGFTISVDESSSQ